MGCAAQSPQPNGRLACIWSAHTCTWLPKNRQSHRDLHGLQAMSGFPQACARTWKLALVVTDGRVMCSGLSESLKLIVAIPFLWGVPPAWELLRCDLTMTFHLQGPSRKPSQCWHIVGRTCLTGCHGCQILQQALKYIRTFLSFCCWDAAVVRASGRSESLLMMVCFAHSRVAPR